MRSIKPIIKSDKWHFQKFDKFDKLERSPGLLIEGSYSITIALLRVVTDFWEEKRLFRPPFFEYCTTLSLCFSVSTAKIFACTGRNGCTLARVQRYSPHACVGNCPHLIMHEKGEDSARIVGHIQLYIRYQESPHYAGTSTRATCPPWRKVLPIRNADYPFTSERPPLFMCSLVFCESVRCFIEL